MTGSPWAAHGPEWWAGFPVRELEPGLLEVHLDQPTSPRHLELYRDHPEGGDVPCVVHTLDDRWVVLDGKHHTLAALMVGRPMPAHVAEEPAGAARPRWVDDYAPARFTPEARRWFG